MPNFDTPTLTNLQLLALPNGPGNGVAVPTGARFWYATALGYKEAADRLIATIIDKRWGRDPSGAPAMFLYRHYVELHLKSLLIEAGELLDEPQAVPPKHYLWVLWTRVRALLLKVGGSSDGPWLRRADEIITSLDDLDPTSFAFRYPVDNAGARTLPEGFRFDAATVRQVIDELHILLDGASTQIDVYKDCKRDAGSFSV